MTTFDIFVDSAANLTDDMVRETGIKVIPFHYIIDGVEKPCYDESRPFDEVAKEFYTLLASGKDIKTSLVCEADFIEAMTPSLESGKDVMLVTITESLSGTYAQAVKAATVLKEKYPDRKISVFDSANASLGEGLLAYSAAKLRDGGASFEDCEKWLDENTYFVNSYVTVNDLKYLRKGGRVSTVAAVAGALLNIKPMLKADGASPATLAVYAKERGRLKSVSALVSAFTKHVKNAEEQTIYITHGDCEDEAKALAEKFRELGAKDVVCEYYDLCTGSHVGPGTLAIFFMGGDRRTPEQVATQKKRILFLRRKSAKN